MKSLLTSLCCLICFVALAQPELPVRERIDSLIKARDHGQAAVLCEKMMVQFPNDIFLIRSLASCQISEGQFADAETTLKSLTNLGSFQPEEQGRYYDICGLLAIRQGKIRVADSLIYQGIQVLQSHNANSEFLSDLFAVQGELKWQLGRPHESLQSLEFAEAIAVQYPDSNRLSRLCNNFGIIYWELSQFEESLEYLHQALSIRQGLYGFEHESLARLFNNIGVVYYHSGDLKKAQDYYTIAYEKWTGADPDHESLPLALNNLGRILVDEKQFASALEHFERSEHLIRTKRGGFVPELTEVLELQSDVYLHLNEADKAIHLLETALLKQDEFNRDDNSKLVHLYHTLGKAYWQNQDAENARFHFDKAKEVMQLTARTESPKYSEILISESTLLWENGDPSTSLELAWQAVDLFSECTDGSLEFACFWTHKTLIPSLINLSDLLLETGQKNTADSCLLLCMDVLDELRAGTDSYESKQFLAEQAPAIYGRRMEILTQEESNELFLYETIERSKAFSLKLAQQAHAAKDFKGIDQTLLEEEKQLKISREFWDRKIREAKEDQEAADIIEASNELARVNLSLDSLLGVLRETSPLYFEHRYNVSPFPLSELKEWLGSDKVYLTFLSSDENLFVLAIDGSHSKVVRLNTSKVSQWIGQLSRCTSDREFILDNRRLSDSLFVESASSLYQVLLEPVSEFLDKDKELIISPQGNIASVNFGLLLSSPVQGEVDYAKLPYVLRSHVVSYLWTTNQLAHSRENDNSQLGIWAIKNHKNGSNLALDEVDRLARISGTNPYVGTDCTESAFKQLAHSYKFLHVATHGLLDEDPKDFKLVFEADTANDGFLHLSEIYSIELDAELITLSACETGSGQWVNGECTSSIASGFAFAGCPSIVMSYWQVNDESTADLMVEFYGGVFKGESKAVALRDAQLTYLESQSDPLKTHPYFWAGFVLLGDSTSGTADHSFWWWSLLAVLGIIILVFANLARRRLT